MRARVSVNYMYIYLAMQTIRMTNMHPSLIDIGCFSHTLNHEGEAFNTSVLTDLMYSWITLFGDSPKTRLMWKSQVGHSIATYCATSWWSQWEVVKMVVSYFADIEPFSCRNDVIGPTLGPKLSCSLLTSRNKASFS